MIPPVSGPPPKNTRRNQHVSGVISIGKSSALSDYLASRTASEVNPSFVSYLANLGAVAEVAPPIAAAIVQELADQRGYLKLIASENYSSLSTQAAMGNLLTDKYAEGFPGQRFYEGCDNVDTVEAYACEQACKLFGAEHAYVQPHSGADANLIAFWSILTAKVEMPRLEELGIKDPGKVSHDDWAKIRAALGNQRLLAMDYACGGHLTHGYRRNLSGKMFDAHQYPVSKETGLLNYDQIAQMAQEIKPLILLAGYSAYPRKIDFRRMREIADSVGAVFMVDMAHFAGLVAGKVFTGDFDPVAHAHVVTSTTHKTLRGPRGGIILCKKEFAEVVDKGCPIAIGGPLPHVMAAKAVAFTEANQPAFRDYAQQIVKNAAALAQACVDEGLTVLTGGTDNHLLLINVTGCGLTGRQAASALRECGITLNFNSLPYDVNGPLVTSGLRIGTPAVTTLGMREDEMRQIAAIIKQVLTAAEAGTIESGPKAGEPSKLLHRLEASAREGAKAQVRALLDRYPVYPDLDLDFLQKYFT
ncbi:MAG: glycine hydroxymethyltransferase [Candidatus Hydrogenedentes bacterium]|nr:glycine hydroxymethyltransferase [Candidatus Hydrogenedentota bacterium]